MPKRQIARQPTSALLLVGCIWFLTGSGSPRLRVIPQLLWRSVISRMGLLPALVAGRTRACDLNHTVPL